MSTARSTATTSPAPPCTSRSSAEAPASAEAGRQVRIGSCGAGPSWARSRLRSLRIRRRSRVAVRSRRSRDAAVLRPGCELVLELVRVSCGPLGQESRLVGQCRNLTEMLDLVVQAGRFIMEPVTLTLGLVEPLGERETTGCRVVCDGLEDELVGRCSGLARPSDDRCIERLPVKFELGLEERLAGAAKLGDGEPRVPHESRQRATSEELGVSVVEDPRLGESNRPSRRARPSMSLDATCRCRMDRCRDLRGWCCALPTPSRSMSDTSVDGHGSPRAVSIGFRPYRLTPFCGRSAGP